MRKFQCTFFLEELTKCPYKCFSFKWFIRVVLFDSHLHSGYVLCHFFHIVNFLFQALRDAKAKIPPNELFKNETDKYSQFNEQVRICFYLYIFVDDENNANWWGHIEMKDQSSDALLPLTLCYSVVLLLSPYLMKIESNHEVRLHRNEGPVMHFFH